MKEGWEEKKLGDVCKKNSNIKWQKNDETEYQYIDLSSVSRDSLTILETSVVSSKNAPSRAKKIVEEDDVIFATTRPTLRRVTIIEKDLDNQICSTGFAVMRANSEKILPQFIFYFLQTEYFIERMETLQRGASYPAVSDTDVNNSLIPIPPLSEQKEIVATLDEAFAAIDTAKYNIKKNIENANELFQSRLNDIFSRKGEGWEEKRLGDVCIVERGSSPRPINKYITDNEDGVNWIKIGDVNENDKYVWKTDQKITKEGAKKSRFVNVGDFILSNSMSFGRPYIMKIPGYIHDGWFVLRLPSELNPDYFWQLLASPYLKKQFEELAAGAIVKNISSVLVKKAIIPLPPFNVQDEIVKETENLHSILNNLQKHYQQKLSNLEDLKQSLLQKAFAGELT